jgi:hypothetical protein
MENGVMVGVFALSSVFDKPKAVKTFMTEHKLEGNEVANNIVYCLYGHEDRNAGSKFLALCRRDAINWWSERYGDELKAFQTFILPPRNGAVYKADNWQEIGITSGISQIRHTVPSGDYSGARKYIYRDGTERWSVVGFKETEKKLILMRLVTKKEKRKAMLNQYQGTQSECHFLLDKQMALF